MTKREYYDLLVKTSLEGGFPSMEGSTCKYHSRDGKRCVAGLLIPDDISHPMFEGNIIDTLCEYNSQLESVITSEEIPLTLIKKCQYLHDVVMEEPWNHELFVERLTKIFGY